MSYVESFDGKIFPARIFFDFERRPFWKFSVDVVG